MPGGALVGYGEVEAGQRGVPWTLAEATRSDFVRFAGASGDFNPIHFDEEFARSAGYPGVFGHGMFVAGLLTRYLTGWLGIDTARSIKFRFRKQIWPGDSVTVTGTILSKDEDGLVSCRFEAANQNGEVLVEADARVALPATVDPAP
ncbi:MAG TPA: MaoC family dehydratase [Pseudonocardia sp.]|jgi:acyl dehydratase|nr:MaoC family dehydratase [Pseudonocardia sp.]